MRDVPLVRDVGPDAATEGPAGASCVDDSMCGELQCAPDFGGFCTGSCEPSTATTREERDAIERSACGAGGTCLSLGPSVGGLPGLCLRACRTGVPRGVAGSCRAGFVCSGQFLRQTGGVADDPACFPFCTADVECFDGLRCNPRTGACDTVGLVATRLPDGAPCDPTRTEMVPGEDRPRNVQCRGTCFGVSGADRTRGLCGSLIDIVRTPSCPDDPDRVQPLTAMENDDQAICIFRGCGSNRDCTGPLRCVLPERMGTPVADLPRRCSYPTPAQPDGTPDPDAGAPTDV